VVRPVGFLRMSGAAILAAALCAYASIGLRAQSKETFVYVASDTTSQRPNPGKGLYLFRLQTENLEVSQNITLVPLGVAAETPNPAFIEIDPVRRVLFAANAIDEFQGKPTGAVSAFAIDANTGALTLLNQRPSMGTQPRALALDKERRHLLVANAGSGTIAVLPIDADGRLGEPTAAAPPARAITVPDRPTPSKAPCTMLDPASRLALACDIALVFRPDGRFLYVVNAPSSTITVFAYDATSGALTNVQSVSTVPDYYDGKNASGAIGVHPNGKYLYVSNRGHNSVVLFGIDPDKGTLTYIEEQGTGGKNPSHFGIQSTAAHLAIANTDSDTVLVCRIDAGNGRLKPSGVFATMPSPVFVKFLSPPDASPASSH
jgi:6-phosphogluconolactonase